MAESHKHFEKRVFDTIGVELSKLPVLDTMPPLGGIIFCARKNELVVGVGYPDRDENGEEFWTEFALVRL
jgi:hypothetical protein